MPIVGVFSEPCLTDDSVREVHQTAIDNGFHEPPESTERLMVLEQNSTAGWVIRHIASFVQERRKPDADPGQMVQSLDLAISQLQALKKVVEGGVVYRPEIHEADLLSALTLEQMALVTTELFVEFIDAVNEGDMARAEQELGDGVLRIFDHAGLREMDTLVSTIVEKMEANKNRPYRHGGKLA